MRVSILVPTYKDEVALDLILKALVTQSYKNFEVIIAEDDDSLDITKIKEKFSTLDILYVSHEDKGNRKAIIMNRALAIANGEYIIFIDGDTIPFSTFIESHVALSEPKTVLCGRRVNLGDKVSSDLRKAKINALDIENSYLKKYQYLNNDTIRNYEHGIRFNPNSFLYKLVQKLNSNIHILASNYSCFKKDIYELNGFNEELPYAPHRDDTDMEWRFIANGCILKSCKYCANLLHLNHARTDRREEERENLEIIEKNRENNQYIAQYGIKKL